MRPKPIIAVIESPAQLMNFLEVFESERDASYFIVRCRKNGTSFQQIKEMLPPKAKVKGMYCYGGNKGFGWFFALCASVVSIVLLKASCDRVCYGNARSAVYRITKRFFSNDVFLVDDGMYLYPFSKRNASRLAGVRIFTRLPINESPSFSVVRIADPRVTPAHDSAWACFIGSKVV